MVFSLFIGPGMPPAIAVMGFPSANFFASVINSSMLLLKLFGLVGILIGSPMVSPSELAARRMLVPPMSKRMCIG